MRLSLYVHAWQALLMFLGGVCCILASVVGYLRSGGAAVLLQQGLVSYLHTGNATFQNVKTDLRNSTLTIHGFRHDDYRSEDAEISGIAVETCAIRLDMWPYPTVHSIGIRGTSELAIRLQQGFFQKEGRPLPEIPHFPLYFEEIDLSLKLGDGPVLRLEDCSGMVRRSSHSGETVGEFRLSRLNGRPFSFHLKALPGGSWEVSGQQLDLDTRSLQTGKRTLDLSARLDPLELLLRALLSGDFGAKGLVTSLRLKIQPATQTQAFHCEGHVAFSNLEFKLPELDRVSGSPVPQALGWMLLEKDALWPAWLTPTTIRTGAAGRVTFSMQHRRLNFFCDEDSTIHVGGGTGEIQPLEALRGFIETDADQRPQRLQLSGFWGRRHSGQLSMQRQPDGGRSFELSLSPRAASGTEELWGNALWIFYARVRDYSGLAAEQRGELPLVAFQIKGQADRFPELGVLPPGMHELSGRIEIDGQFTTRHELRLEQVRWRDGGLAYGGDKNEQLSPLLAQVYGPFSAQLKELWGSGAPWKLQQVELSGKANVLFDASNRWQKTVLSDWQLNHGNVVYQGKSTELGAAGIKVDGVIARRAGQDSGVEIGCRAYTLRDRAMRWQMVLAGIVEGPEKGVLTFEEHDIPLELHPERERIDKSFKSGLFNVSVNRRTELRFENGKFVRIVEPLK